MSAQRITRGFAWNHLYKIVEFGGVNLYAIIVARAFGPAVGGNYSVYLSISGTLAIISAFAVDGVLLRYLPRILRGERSYGEATVEGIRPFLIDLLSFRLLVSLGLTLLLIVGLGILPNYSPGLETSLGTIRLLWPYLVIYLLAQAVVAFGTYTLIGLLQTKWVFFASVASRTLLLAVGILLVATRTLSIEGAVALHACSAVVIAAMLLYWIHRHVEQESSPGLRIEFANFRKRLFGFVSRPRRVRIFLLMPFMLYGITTWGSDVLSTVLGRQPDILMMRAILGENTPAIGLYDAAARLGLMTEYVALFGLGGTLVSVFSEFAHEDEQNFPDRSHNGKRLYPRLLKARRDISGYQTVATTPLFFFMLAFAPLVIQVAYGMRFSGATPMFVASLILQALTVITFGGGMQVTSLVVIGKERVVFLNRLAWGILNLVVNYFLILHYGGLGAMIGTQAANMGVIVVESMLAAHWIGQSLVARRSAAIVAIAALSTFVTWYAVSFFDGFLPLVRLVIAAILMGALTFAGYALFRIPEAKNVWAKIRSLASRSAEPVSLSA